MGLRDIASLVLRSQIPRLMATANLQLRLVTSAPGVDPPTFTGGWQAVIGQLELKSDSQERDDRTGIWFRKRMAHLTVSDAVAIKDGDQVAVNGVQPIWTVNPAREPHLFYGGICRYTVIHDEPIFAGGDRGGGR